MNVYKNGRANTYKNGRANTSKLARATSRPAPPTPLLRLPCDHRTLAVHLRDFASRAEVLERFHLKREIGVDTGSIADARDVAMDAMHDLMVGHVMNDDTLAGDGSPDLVCTLALEAEVVQLIPPPMERHQRPRRVVEEHADHHVLAMVHHWRLGRQGGAMLELGKLALIDHPRGDRVGEHLV